MISSSNVIFISFLIFGIYFFIKNIKKIYRNINLGLPIDHIDNIKLRLKNTFKIAFGQSKMMNRPIIGFLHFMIYIGFFILNLEFIEIIIDGIFNTHRIFNLILGQKIYNILIFILEFFATILIVCVIIFFIRRNFLSIYRFSFDLNTNEKNDANIILIIELILILFFLLMNASYFFLYNKNIYMISSNLFFFIKYFPQKIIFFIERISWWMHFITILFFLNYLVYSKHLHIFLAFPSIFFSNIKPLGRVNNLHRIKKEIERIENQLDINSKELDESNSIIFGASDIFDLNKIQLLHAYSCTECGRCSNVCPAHLSGKKLSPRKILMNTRDRLEEVSINIDKNKGVFISDNKKLLGDLISHEEIWACTTCNACTEECPILLDPLSIILEMRRYLVMEESNIKQGLNLMMNNIEINDNPWAFDQNDRLNWIYKK